MPVRLPGRAIFYVAPLIGAVAALLGADPIEAALVAIWYLVWGAPPWGYLQLLGRPVVGKEPTRTEAILLWIAGGSVPVALTLRHLLAGPIAPLICAGYEFGWRVAPRAPVLVGELIAGALWGFMLAVLFL